jgi:hypothetical protein
MVKRITTFVVAAAMLLLFAVGAGAQGVFDLPGGTDLETMGKLANGEMAGVTSWNLIGMNEDADSAAAEDIWDYGGEANWPSGAETLYASSDAAGDTMDLLIEGLDASGDEVSDTVTLAGLTFTAVTQTFWRVHRVTVQGSTANVGNIYVHIDDVDAAVADGIPDTPQTDTRAYIPIDRLQSSNGFFTCPNDRSCYAIESDAGGGEFSNANLTWIFTRATVAAGWVMVSNGLAPQITRLRGVHRFGELEDLRFRVHSGADNKAYNAQALILIFEN